MASLRAAVALFVSDLGTSRRGSPRTAEAYARDLRQLCDFALERTGGDPETADVDVFLLRGFLGSLSRKVERAAADEEAERQKLVDWLAGQVSSAQHTPQPLQG